MDTQIESSPKTFEELILDHIRAGTALIDAHSLRLLKANPLFLTFLDKYIGPTWQHGQVVGYVLPEFLNRPRFMEILRQVAETGESFQAKERTFPEADEGKSYWNWSVRPVRDEDGQIRYLLIIFKEVTESVAAQRMADEAYTTLNRINNLLEEERQRLQIIEIVAHSVRKYLDIENIGAAALDSLNACFRSIDVCLHIADPVQQELRLLQIRSKNVASYSRSFLEHVSYESPLLIAQAYKRHEPIILENVQHDLLAQELEQNPELMVLHVGGYICVPLWFKDHFEGALTAIFSEPVSAHGPEVKAFLGCSTYIAAALAHARLYDAVNKEKEHKSNFLSIASHELRTPIAVIRGYAELLQAKIQEGISLDNPRTRRAIDSIADQSYRLTRLLNTILDLTRIEQDQLFVQPAPHDLAAAITHFVETSTIITATHRFKLTLEGLQAGDSLIVCYDEDRIDQVLNNLVSNAVKYSPVGSEIEIGLRFDQASPSHTLIWVKDAGIGIGESELPYIFERFHRAGNLNRSISGLGIGLYLVSEITRRHNGRVWVESAKGCGSTFFVQLPLHSDMVQ
jgi:signal transduction histidine kinase